MRFDEVYTLSKVVSFYPFLFFFFPPTPLPPSCLTSSPHPHPSGPRLPTVCCRCCPLQSPSWRMPLHVKRAPCPPTNAAQDTVPQVTPMPVDLARWRLVHPAPKRGDWSKPNWCHCRSCWPRPPNPWGCRPSSTTPRCLRRSAPRVRLGGSLSVMATMTSGGRRTVACQIQTTCKTTSRAQQGRHPVTLRRRSLPTVLRGDAPVANIGANAEVVNGTGCTPQRPSWAGPGHTTVEGAIGTAHASLSALTLTSSPPLPPSWPRPPSAPEGAIMLPRLTNECSQSGFTDYVLSVAHNTRCTRQILYC
jgi:hypothetical protein